MKEHPLDADYSKEAIDEACRLVGSFFLDWAILESSIDSVIHKLFNIEGLAANIITANLKFTDKLYIVQTILRWQGSVVKDWERRTVKLGRRIGRLYKMRNLLAHNIFVPLRNKSVRFYKIEARGNLDFPDIRWSKQDFECQSKLIEAAHKELDELTKQISNRRKILDALIANPSPIEGNALQGILGPHFHRTQSPPDSQTTQ